MAAMTTTSARRYVCSRVRPARVMSLARNMHYSSWLILHSHSQWLFNPPTMFKYRGNKFNNNNTPSR